MTENLTLFFPDALLLIMMKGIALSSLESGSLDREPLRLINLAPDNFLFDSDYILVGKL